MADKERALSAPDSNLTSFPVVDTEFGKITESSESSECLEVTSPDTTATNGGECTFRLFDLPTELWIKIGQMVIDDSPARRIGRINMCAHELVSDSSEDEDEDWDESGRVVTSCSLTPPAVLQQTCTALRKELRNGFYRTKITVEVPDYAIHRNYKDFGQFFHMIGPEARRQLSPVVCEARLDYNWRTVHPDPLTFGLMADWEFEMMVVRLRSDQLRRQGGKHQHKRLGWEITFL